MKRLILLSILVLSACSTTQEGMNIAKTDSIQNSKTEEKKQKKKNCVSDKRVTGSRLMKKKCNS